MICIAAVCVTFYAYTRPALPTRTGLWPPFLTWLIVSAQAAGFYGITTVVQRR